MKELNYVFNNKDLRIPLNLYEAEKYAYAVLVHPLIGNLVAYSNKGRYEPLLAKSWSTDSEGVWTFELHEGMVCENNEPITPDSFKRSIEVSLKYLSARSEVPVLSKLVGYRDFLEGKTSAIRGISASGTQIAFRFTEPTHSGVVQILSFAPFGFICSDNRNPDGSWKDNEKFVASGPYKIVHHSPGLKHVLELRGDWKFENPHAPKRVNFYFSLDAIEKSNLPTILDSDKALTELTPKLKKYNLVPEYINPILLSPNGQSGFFALRENRLLLQKAIAIEKEKLPLEIENHYRSEFFYPNQPPKIKDYVFSQDFKYKKPVHPIVIQGKRPEKGDKKYLNWLVLEPALRSLDIDYVFDDTAKNRAEIMSDRYDIRFQGSSIGGGAEAWGLAIVFCSEIGPRFPDPSGRICKAVKAHMGGAITNQEFTEEFNQAVFDDAAVLPVTHFGIMMYLSSEVNRDSISPLISVVRFDQLELE